MKPDGGLTGEMEDIEVEPSELFTQLGMLVVESRLPEPTPKGRTQGPHCPGALGELNPPWHSCDMAYSHCQKAKTMLKQMHSLWHNRVPMCIEVVLLPDCNHGAQRTSANDVTLPTDKVGSLLLEQWTIQALPRRASDTSVSMKMLFQAVQSHLYFSQLSAWLNLTKGKIPTNVCYRISPPGDFCTSCFSQTPEHHTFPVAAVSKSLSIKVTAGCLPRMQEIPHIRCREPHGEPRLTSPHPRRPADVTPCARKASRSPPCHRSHDPRGDRNSARFQKPRVVIEPSKQVDCKRTEVLRDKRTMAPEVQHRNVDLHVAKPSPCVLSGKTGDQSGTPNSAKNTGAIPKRVTHKSLPSPRYESDYASSAPELESMGKEKRHSMGAELPDLSTSSESPHTSPKVIVTHNSSSQVYYSKDKVNWILQNVVNKESSTDSDSSSPDIDRYLNKTLAGRIDPLSPVEMENYLDSLAKISPSKSKREYNNSVAIAEQSHIYDINRCDAKPTTSKKSSCSKLHDSSGMDQDLNSIKASFQTLLLRKGLDHSFNDKLLEKTQPEISTQENFVSKSTSQSTSQRASCSAKPASVSSSENGGVDDVTFTLEDDTAEARTHSHEYSQTCYSNGATGVRAESSRSGQRAVNGHSSQFMEPLSQYEQDTCNILQDHVTAAAAARLPVEVELEDPFSDDPFSSPGSSQQSSPPSSSSSSSALPFHKSISCPGSSTHKGFSVASPHPRSGNKNANNLMRNVMRRETVQNEQNKENFPTKKAVPIPSDFDQMCFQKSLRACANVLFHAATGLPMQSSPAPVKKRASDHFDYDSSLSNPRAIKNSISCVNLDKQQGDDDNHNNNGQKLYSTSAPASTNCLLGNFEESMLNGRLEPTGVVEGFTADIGASGAFCPKHITLPMTAFFFSLSDDNAPSPYLGHINLEALGRRGYHVPKKGTVQVTIFNPNKTVVKMFVVVYNLEDMPANCQTFLRQRTLYMPVTGSLCDTPEAPSYLRYLIHLRFSSSKSNKVYLHTDIRLIFARDKFEFDSRVANYELRSFTEGPINPKFSPKR